MPTYPRNLSFEPYSPSLSFDYTPTNIEGQGMDPLVLAGLITGGTSLAGGFLGGLSKAQERRYREKQIAKMLALLKPQGQFYQTPHLAGYDKVLAQALMGNLQERFGEGRMGKWGIDIGSALNVPRQFPGSQNLKQRCGNMGRY